MSNSNEMYHYGVLGMKWGVRRGRYAQSYAKGVKKLKKLDAKSDELRLEGKKRTAEAAEAKNKARRTIRASKRQRLLDKAAQLDAEGALALYKSEKYRKKGQKFFKSMQATFEGVDMSQLNKEDVEYGKRYLKTILH